MATDTQVINSQNMAPQPTIKAPTFEPTPVDPNIATSAISSVAGQFEAINKQQEQAQAEQKALADSQMSLQNALLGKTADTQAYEDQAGVTQAKAQQNQFVQQLADLNAQAQSLQREASAIPIANRLAYQKAGIAGTESQVQNVNYDQLQQNALKALSIAQQADIASAALTGSTVRLNAAKEKAQQMVDLKYKPIEDQIALKKNQYELNKDTLMQIDKKRAEALQLSIQKEERDIAERKAVEKGVQDIGLTLRKYGVADSVVKDVLSAKSVNEAIIKAGTLLQDPKAKLELASLRAEINLKEAQARKADREARLLTEPTEKQKKDAAQAVASAKASAQTAQDKIDTVDAILDKGVGISARVGPSILSRGVVGPVLGGAVAGGGLGPVGAVAGAVAGGATGAISAFSGEGQQVSGAIHQLTGGLTLQALIDAKKNGATFGALTESELRILAASATKLNDWEIKDDNGKPTGYWDIDEKSFKDELKTIQNLSRKALQQSQGTLLSPEESSLLDTTFQEEQPSADQYF